MALRWALECNRWFRQLRDGGPSSLLAVAIHSLYKVQIQVSFVPDVRLRRWENSMPKSFRSSCCLLLTFLVVFGATLLAQSPQWEQLPPTPHLPKPDDSGTVAACSPHPARAPSQFQRARLPESSLQIVSAAFFLPRDERAMPAKF
jgi:hypothetical protein